MIPLLAVVAVLATRSYQIRVDIPTTALVAERPAQVSVAVRAHRRMRTLRLLALPGLDVDANAIRIALRRTGKGEFAGSFAIPVRGPWYLAVEAADPPASTTVPLSVTAPGAMPAPIAWAIACIPLVLFGVFIARERRRLRDDSQDEIPVRPKTAPT